MTPLLRQMLQVRVALTAVVQRGWTSLERLFCSKAQVAQRAAGRSEARKRQEMEVDRLDRLRNPGNYRGR